MVPTVINHKVFSFLFLLTSITKFEAKSVQPHVYQHNFVFELIWSLWFSFGYWLINCRTYYNVGRWHFSFLHLLLLLLLLLTAITTERAYTNHQDHYHGSYYRTNDSSKHFTFMHATKNPCQRNIIRWTNLSQEAELIGRNGLLGIIL